MGPHRSVVDTSIHWHSGKCLLWLLKEGIGDYHSIVRGGKKPQPLVENEGGVCEANGNESYPD